MRIWFLVIGLLSMITSGISQIVSLSFRGDADLYEKDIIRTADDKTIILCGRNIGPLEESVVVIALDGSNELLWKRHISSAQTILRPGFLKAMPDGNVLVVMDDFAPGANLGGSNISFAILMPDGDVKSQKRIGTVLYEELDDVTFLDNGNMLFLGNMASDNGYGVFLLEVDDDDSILEIKTFQIGLYDYLTKLIAYDGKLYAFGTTYFFPGPAQPMLVEMDNEYNVTDTWVFTCPDMQGKAGVLFPDENGFHVEVSYEDRAVFFRFENGVITSQPKDHGYGIINNIHNYQGSSYYFNGDEYSLKRNQEKKYHLGTEKTGMTKIAFGGDSWFGIGSLTEENKSVIHFAKDILEPGEDCGSYAFGSLPAQINKTITVQSPANNEFAAPLVRYFNTTDQTVTDAVVDVAILCTKVSAEENSDEPWEIFPNPSAEFINISYQGEYQIAGVDGNIILCGHTDGKIDVKMLSSGYYIVKAGNKVSSFIKL